METMNGKFIFIVLLTLGIVATSIFYLSRNDTPPTVLPDNESDEQIVKTDSLACGNILYNGKPSSKINLVFISDGFIDKNKFIKNVEDFIGNENVNDKFALFNYPPYNKLRNNFNIFTFFDPTVNWDCSSTVDLKRDSLCLTEFTVYDALSKYCTWAPESDFFIMLSNKPYRASASSYLPEEFRKLRIVRVSIDTSANSEKSNLGMNITKATFLHEITHALGDLSDEYIDFGKEGFKPIAGIGARNIDSEGCPTWCAGTLNVQSFAYEKYVQYKSCTVGLDIKAPADTDQFRMCYLQAAISKESDSMPTEIDLGQGCYAGAGCFWTAGGANGFRSIQNSLMRHGSGRTPPELGSVNEKLVREAVENKIREREADISAIQLKILSIKNSDFPRWWLNANVYQINPQPLPFKIEFILLNQVGKEIVFSTNDRNYVISTDQGIVSINLATNRYEVLYAHYLNTKQGQTSLDENDYVDINFIIKHNKIKVQESYRFYLKKLNFVKI